MKKIEAPKKSAVPELRVMLYLADVRAHLSEARIYADELYMTIEDKGMNVVKYVHLVTEGAEYKHYVHPVNDVDPKNVAYFLGCSVRAAR